ncbi:NAD(P)H-dependent oxidoreductase [Kordiimonas aestuarii]|uniref:NAD(P)H-dependent oxidoreductase n=1 Tax=Kordiimonas aestuarii TaxID=1005925 RepID=UPI0021D2363F|nr:NAD(P)H-dependent oxidoreductase [Kordiimonas aestuarii]
MRHLLLIYAHPTPRGSYLNRYLTERLGDMPNVELRDLYQLYPDFYIDAAQEQESLGRADVVVMQFPIRWFSVPSIIREWQDSVLTKGFAFGPGGNALKGKRFMAAVSTGGQERSYEQGEPHGAGIDAYLAPVVQTAVFCGMEVVEPFVVHGARDLDTRKRDDVAQAYMERLRALTQGEDHG